MEELTNEIIIKQPQKQETPPTQQQHPDQTTCSICVEKFNKLRPPIQCQQCQHTSCSKCCRMYLLGQPTPQCMHCKNQWTRSFLLEHFPKTFLQELKQQQVQMKMEQELTLMPQTQNILDHRKDQAIRRRELQKEIDELQIIFVQLQGEMEDIRRHQRNCRNEIYRMEDEKAPRTPYVRPCPADNCRGFLNASWKCGLCDTIVCNQCHEIKTTNPNNPNNNPNNQQPTQTTPAVIEEPPLHICLEENIETAKMIQSDSRPCPKCNAFIFKIEGCNQIWCVNCNTAFDWRTRRIIENTRYFHNPHYTDWLRQQTERGIEVHHGDTPDNQCLREIDNHYITRFYEINRNLKQHNPEFANILKLIMEIQCRKTMEIQQMILPRFQTTPDKENEDLRFLYLIQEIDKPAFLIALSTRHKRNEIRREKGLILEMFVVSMTDILLRLIEMVRHNQSSFCEKPRKRQEVKLLEPFLLEMQGLVEYTNQQFVDLSRSFGFSQYCEIHPNTFHFHTKSTTTTKQIPLLPQEQPTAETMTTTTAK